MTVLYRHFTFLVAAAALGACGLVDDGPGGIEAPRPSPGAIMVTDDWTCIADDNGAWDCTELDPEPAYVPTLPEVPKYQQDTQIVAISGTTAAILPEPEPEPEPEPKAALGEEQLSPSGSAVDWAEIPADGYVLQLAAHRSRANAERALSLLDAPVAEIVRTLAGGADLFIILAGNYPDLTTAKTAALEFQARNGGADFWVRSAADFLDAL